MSDISARTRANLPPRPFLYTIDQLSVILNLAEVTLKDKYLYFVGRTPGVQSLDVIAARNIARFGDKPEWRVEERELIRWMKRKGFRGVG